jgi:hypothetical protein
MQAAFAGDMAASDLIDLPGWQRRPVLQRLKEVAARLGGPLF